MLRVLNCVVHEHDLRLVALSALICILGCSTTTMLLARGSEDGRRPGRGAVACTAAVFGGSVWSLHFVAMLAFIPGGDMAYAVDLTALSGVVATGGAWAGFGIWRESRAGAARLAAAGILVGLGISAMHYIGLAATTFAGFLLIDPAGVAASVLVSVAVPSIALARASDLRTPARRIEVGAWLALAIGGLHFTGMAAVAIVPGGRGDAAGAVLGTTALAVAVGGVTVAILTVGLAVVLMEQHMSRRTLRELARMRRLSNLAQEVLLIHRGGIVLEVNSAGERLFRAPAAHLVGRPVTSLFAADSVPILMRREACPPSDRRPEEVEVRAVGGADASVEISCQSIDYLGQPATVVALRDLTDRKRDEARIRHLAGHDALTDLPNRTSLRERLSAALDAAGLAKTSFAVVYIDLDRFKPVNDLYGHAAGDALLVQASRRMAMEMRSDDMLARIGGDEFIMVIEGAPRPEQVSATATRVLDALRRPFRVEGKRIEVGASIGVALFPDDGGDIDGLLRAADAAMYRAKEEGRGAVRFYEAAMNAKIQSRLQLEGELAEAVDRGELLLHYQPIVNAATGEVETFEALVRWQHPARGMVPPLEFIPLAEETGLIDAVGRWVIEAACREAATWQHPWRVSVNVSPKQFHQSDVCVAIADAIRANALDPGRVVVEVTEGVLIEDAAKAVATLNRLRALGVRVALDDFGTGFSSLSYLQLFKFDKFKIDKSFVRRLGESEEALTLTRTIVTLGHNLGLHVTAEGVETADQLAILQALGCDQIQGYLVARPAPMGAFTEVDRLRTLAMFGMGRQRLSA